MDTSVFRWLANRDNINNWSYYYNVQNITLFYFLFSWNHLYPTQTLAQNIREDIVLSGLSPRVPLIFLFVFSVIRHKSMGFHKLLDFAIMLFCYYSRLRNKVSIFTCYIKYRSNIVHFSDSRRWNAKHQYQSKIVDISAKKSKINKWIEFKICFTSKMNY